MASALFLLLGLAIVVIFIEADNFCPKERKGDKCKAKE